MSNSLSFPRFKAIDGNGNPIRGGKLYTFEAGTSTPLAAYTDADRLVAAANPIILDSEGEATVYLKGAYKLNLTNRDDGQVPGWPIDDVSKESFIGVFPIPEIQAGTTANITTGATLPVVFPTEFSGTPTVVVSHATATGQDDILQITAVASTGFSVKNVSSATTTASWMATNFV